jgi:hypothetical protein
MSVTQMFSRCSAQRDQQIEAGERRGAGAGGTIFTSSIFLPTSFSAVE